MTIIAYRSATDIDVQFEDGQKALHKSYGNFVRGNIAPPKDRVGKSVMSKCGMNMVIIAYRCSTDLDVRFEDGQKVYHKTYGCFKKGSIAPPQDPRKINRIGESAIANCGMKMTIVAYRGAMDIDVEFDDGTVVLHKTYSHFQKGNIKNPKLAKSFDTLCREGEQNVAKNGLQMTIIVYRNTRDIDVQFDDKEKTIVRHKTYQCFKRGEIKNPNQKHGAKFKNRTGESAIATCGKKMTIIAYRSATDIDVEFDDGTVVFNKSYSHFKKGKINYPARLSPQGEDP